MVNFATDPGDTTIFVVTDLGHDWLATGIPNWIFSQIGVVLIAILNPGPGNVVTFLSNIPIGNGTITIPAGGTDVITDPEGASMCPGTFDIEIP